MWLKRFGCSAAESFANYAYVISWYCYFGLAVHYVKINNWFFSHSFWTFWFVPGLNWKCSLARICLFEVDNLRQRHIWSRTWVICVKEDRISKEIVFSPTWYIEQGRVVERTEELIVCGKLCSGAWACLYHQNSILSLFQTLGKCSDESCKCVDLDWLKHLTVFSRCWPVRWWRGNFEASPPRGGEWSPTSREPGVGLKSLNDLVHLCNKEGGSLCVCPISHFGICYETQLFNTNIKVNKTSQLSWAINSGHFPTFDCYGERLQQGGEVTS